jgi:DNA-binding GntR family transcriptional regulator
MRSVVKRTETLREQAFLVIVDELKRGRFAPGERLTEEGLAKRLGVSRTPIREALGQLTRQGVLRARAGGGYEVPAPNMAEIRHIIAVRMLLEPPAVRMASEEYGRVEIERISRAIDAEFGSVSRAQPGQFAKANEDFRHAMFDGISNRALSALISRFASHIHFVRDVTLDDVNLRREIVERQKKIRDALQQHQGTLAEELWCSYLRFTEEVLLGALARIESRPLRDDPDGPWTDHASRSPS